MNKSEKKQSLASLISEKRNLNDLIIINDFTNQITKTKEMNLILKKIDATNSLIILDSESKKKIFKSLRNLPNIKVSDINHFSGIDIVKYKKLIFTVTSVKELEKRYK